MNQLNQIIHVLSVQIEAEKHLLNKGKGNKERLEKLQGELKSCLKQL